MDRRRLRRRIRTGRVRNIRIADLLDLCEGLGFEPTRVRGSHHILRHTTQPVALNLQEVGGQAKPYQVRQLLELVMRYNLELED